MAVDGANQTDERRRARSPCAASSARELGISLRPSRDRTRAVPFRARGRLLRPDDRLALAGLLGHGHVTAKRGTKVVSTKRAPLSRMCEYSATFKFRTRTSRSLQIRASFGGNDVLADEGVEDRTARLG